VLRIINEPTAAALAYGTPSFGGEDFDAGIWGCGKIRHSRVVGSESVIPAPGGALASTDFHAPASSLDRSAGII